MMGCLRTFTAGLVCWDTSLAPYNPQAGDTHDSYGVISDIPYNGELHYTSYQHLFLNVIVELTIH